MDFRRTGARFILRVRTAEGLSPDQTPYRVRLSIRRAPPFEAGTFVSFKARLLPPARASLPGGYDFARDAWFARLGAVGNVLGRIEVIKAPVAPGLMMSAMMALDRGRNALARRIDKIVGGDAGAIAAAMVTGKRDLLSEEAKEIIREAGIFHIITISGVQMTLVAGIFFVGLRRLLALSQTLALSYPIKKWAALFAIAGAIFYDIATGSRVGTERALLAALVAVYEARMAAWRDYEASYRLGAYPAAGKRKSPVLETLRPFCAAGRSGSCLQPSVPPRPRPPSWPIIFMNSAPMC
jgi:competence protein ComEC